MSKLHLGDCMDVMRSMPCNSIDAIVTDPPYGLAFMGAKWDSFNGSTGAQTVKERQAGGKRYADDNKGAPRYANSHGKKVTWGEMAAFQAAMTPIFEEALRVAKPGAHLLCFGGTRTFHRMACAIEDAGWEIRDCIMWVYGSGFPKSMDVGKAIDKSFGADRKVVGYTRGGDKKGGNYHGASDRGYTIDIPITEATSDEAKKWDGWGTCLKPAWEPIIVARKPLDGTVVHNVLTWGVGALNIDACRVGTETMVNRPAGNKAGGNSPNMSKYGMPQDAEPTTATGRFPANLVHDGSQLVLDLFPDSNLGSNKRPVQHKSDGKKNVYSAFAQGKNITSMRHGGNGSAARFFYCAKASKKDRGEGNDHPTVKPTALMEWLVKLVTPEGGVVLDPFMGSGSTGMACANLGRYFIGVEREWKYMQIAGPRIAGRERETGMHEAI